MNRPLLWATGLAIAVGALASATLLPRAQADEMKHEHEASGQQHQHSATPHTAQGEHSDMHAAVPAAYQGAHPAPSVWTDQATIERGRTIYGSRCATCHGERGDGRGPAAQALPMKPPDLRDRHIVDEMTPGYWFWRVSEGGQLEPYKSLGSAMPASKHDLSVDDRWAVIAYQHSLSGHKGPHVASEHPQMESGHGEHGGASHHGMESHGAAPAANTHGGH